MLLHILTRTPVYVWAILAFLIYRGVIASRERDVTTVKLLIIPAVMLALSLQDIAAKFGADPGAWGPWLAGMAAIGLQRWKFGSAQVGAGAAPGRVRIRGSWMPLAAMMAVFVTKYVASVMLAMQPALAANGVFVLTVCALFGAFNGYFLGQLARDLGASRRMLQAANASAAAPA
jgi:hypothetical protein